MAKRSVESAIAPPADRGPQWLSRAALLLLLVQVAARPFLQESVGYEAPAWTRGLAVPAGPAPATTLAWVSATAAAAVLARGSRQWRGTRYGRTGAEVGAALLALAGLVSVSAAGQKRVAIVGALSFLGQILLCLTLAQLLDSPWRRRLLVAVALASGAAFSVRGLQQRLREFPETLRYYEQHRAEFVAAAGPDGAGRLFDFEARLHSQAVTGFFSQANVAGSLLAMTVVLAAGTAWAMRRRAPLAAATGLLIALLAGATLLLTQSKGAVAACGAGLAMVFAAEAAHGRIAARARQTWRGFWIGLALAVLVVVVVGAIRGGLPTRSLLFRWQYWRGAAETFLRAPFTGVGSDNFGRYFTRDKPVECPEDVQDPHSWLVRLAVEWGPLGLAGFVALLVGLSRQLLAPRDLPATSGRPHSAIVCLALVWLLSMTAVVAVFGTSDAAYLVLTFGVAAAVWPVAAFGVCASRSATADAPVDGGLVPSAPLAGAAFAFLLHTVTDTALFAPGAATLFFALLAGLVSPHVRRGGQSSESRPTAAMASLLIGAGAIAVFAALLVVPTAQTAERLDRARKSAGPAEFDAYVAAPVHASYAAAIESDPLDATAAIELAGELAHRCRTAPQADQVLSLLDLAQRRDPDHIGIDGLRAGVLAIRFDATHDPADLAGAVEAAGRAVAADATRPQPRLALAALLERLDAVAPDAANRERAVAELRVALRLDAERVYVSPLHRLSAARREEIARQIETLLRPATRPSGAGTPQSQPSSAAIRSS